ncbi:MAG TPA: SurA N-terminal domain-containing protein [Rhizomicrobium sp.]|nr:SurA N-terminal domain-containing protein [Rhizomicrobium sp.]
MLQAMRKYTKSWVSSVFMGALALSFGVWGIADIFKGTTDTSVATVGSTAISADEYQRDFNNTLKQQLGPDGKPMSSDTARKLGVPKQVLEQMISRAALDNVATKLGLTTADGPVIQEVRSIRGFAGPLGSFDHDTFLRIINDRGYTEQGFLALVRGDITRNQLLSAGRAGFALPPGYVSALFSYLNEVRAADYVVVPASAAGEVPAPTDEQLTAYVKSHPEKFSTPEYREVDYAEIGPDDIASQTQPTDAQLRQQYELRKSDPRFGYNIPEKRDVEQITFTTEADAQSAKAKIDAGQSFADVAKSLGKQVDGLGTVSKDDLGARGAATFAVADGGVTAPQKNLTGWVLLHVTKITPAVNKSFDDVKADIAGEVSAELAQAKLGDIANKYTDANSGGLSLTDAGKKVGMHTGKIAAVDANGLAPDGTKTPLADDPDAIKQVFAAEVGEEGDPFTVKSGKLYVLKVDGVIPPKLKPLDQVRVQAAAEWTAAQRQKMLVAKADELVKEANATDNMDAAVAAAGTPVVHSGRLYRPGSMEDAASGALPTPIVGKLFETKPGVAIDGPGPNGSYIVARVTGVLHRPLPVGSPQFAQGAKALSEQSSQDMDTLLAQAARNDQKVKINQANADRVIGGGADEGS